MRKMRDVTLCIDDGTHVHVIDKFFPVRNMGRHIRQFCDETIPNWRECMAEFIHVDGKPSVAYLHNRS